MKQGWEYKKLGEVGNIVTGSTPSTKDESNYSPREYCFVKPSDLPSKGIANIEETEYYVSKKGLSKSRVLPAGSVLVSCIGSIGKIGILTKEACSNQQINAIIPNNGIDSKFIAYIICAYRFLLESIANAPVVPIINKTDFSKIAIPLPPKPIQLAIVSELDKINELIRLKKEQLKDYDNLAQSIFYEMFGDPVENEMGWEVKKWGDLFHTILGKMLDKSKQINNSSQYKYLANINVQWGYFDFSDLRSMSFTDKELTKYELKTNDLLLCEGGEAGRCAIWNETNEIILFQKAIHRARLIDKNSADVLYIRYWMQFYKKNNGLKDYISKSTIEHLTGEKLKKLPIPLPPLPLQQLFAERIEQIEKQKAEVQQTIKDLETLLASRMQYWFE